MIALKRVVFFFLCTSIILPVFLASGQPGEPGERIRFMFYNVENLFDSSDHPATADEEFTPSGERHWTPRRYRTKLHRIFQVLAAAGEWEPPELIGLCEVENREVLNDLISETPLSKFQYGIVHLESPDSRGIDVALLYRRESFTPLAVKETRVRLPLPGEVFSRSILYVEGLVPCLDTLRLILVHWPSRYRVPEARMHAASLVCSLVDSLVHACRRPAIMLAGDFNDNPDDASLRMIEQQDHLLNLSPPPGRDRGTMKYRGVWYTFDQIWISRDLARQDEHFYLKEGSFRIFNEEWLLTEDKTYLGLKPYRSFEGYRYTGGYSDHLPVMVDLTCGN